MAETTNFGLYVTDDTDETFSSWREKMNATTNSNMTIIDAALDEIEDDLDNHIANTSNPHNVTKTQVGLGNVPNVSTNDQTPTYTVASANAELASGETLSTAFGKIAKAIKSFIAHLSADNPHSISKSTVGLGNVPNVSTNDQTPTYTEASSNTALSSGEKLSVAMGKIAKIVSSFIAHLSASNPHNITASGIGAAAASHTHNYAATSHTHGNITSDGKVGSTSGVALVTTTGGAVTTRNITDNTTGAISTNTYLITERTVRYHSNRTTGAAQADTNYTTNMFRGIALYSSDTNPSYNGQINFTYG